MWSFFTGYLKTWGEEEVQANSAEPPSGSATENYSIILFKCMSIKAEFGVKFSNVLGFVWSFFIGYLKTVFAVVSSNVLGFVWSILIIYLKTGAGGGGRGGGSSESPEAPLDPLLKAILLSYVFLVTCSQCLGLFLVTSWTLFVFQYARY